MITVRPKKNTYLVHQFLYRMAAVIVIGIKQPVAAIELVRKYVVTIGIPAANIVAIVCIFLLLVGGAG